MKSQEVCFALSEEDVSGFLSVVTDERLQGTFSEMNNEAIWKINNAIAFYTFWEVQHSESTRTAFIGNPLLLEAIRLRCIERNGERMSLAKLQNNSLHPGEVLLVRFDEKGNVSHQEVTQPKVTQPTIKAVEK